MDSREITGAGSEAFSWEEDSDKKSMVPYLWPALWPASPVCNVVDTMQCVHRCHTYGLLYVQLSLSSM